MRDKLMTQEQAQALWDKMRSEIALNGRMGCRGVSLPSIDMGKVFAGRKQMTWFAISEQVTDIINAWQPPL